MRKRINIVSVLCFNLHLYVHARVIFYFQFNLINYHYHHLYHLDTSFLEYLNEENFVKFLSNVVSNLKDDGFLIIKENVNLSDDKIIFIEEEGSLIRPTTFFERVFKKLRLNVKRDELVIILDIINFP